MPRLFLLLTLALCAAPVRAQQPDAPRAGDADDEVERVTVHLVSVPVSVTDRDGRFVADLGERDFRVTENGVAQTISNFASVEQPFSVLLLLDTSGSTQIRLKDIQDSAIAFVNQLRPQDRVLPVAFDNDAVALMGEWTGDREKLTAAIRAAHTGMVREANDTRVMKGRDGKEITLRHVNTRLYDAIHNAAAVLRETKGRKAMIVFTDGFDNASKDATRKSTLAEAEELDALIYVVQYPRYLNDKDRERQTAADERRPVPTGPSVGAKGTVEVTSSGGHQSVVTSRPSPMLMPPGGVVVPPSAQRPLRPFGTRHPLIIEAEKYLEDLTEKTGGRYYYADDVERINLSFAAIADELRRMYSIGYHPTPLAKPGERREVKIKVGRERVSVRARKAYVFKPR